MAIVELPASAPKPSPPSTLAFASDVPCLAAGTAPGSTADYCLTIYGATPEAGLGDPAAAFHSPAGFWRVSWSKPTETASSSYSHGLIAGGLDNGSVAVWDPRHMLRSAEGSTSGWKSELHIIEDYFPSEDPSGAKWKCDFQIIEDYCATPDGRRAQLPRRSATAAAGSSSDNPGSSATLRAQLMRDLGWGFDRDDFYFAPATPHCQVFDTRKMLSPVKEFCISSGGISSLSWCPCNDMIIGSTFNKDIFVWEGRTEKLIWKKRFDTMVTDIHWSKVNAGSFATATQQDIALYNLNGLM